MLAQKRNSSLLQVKIKKWVSNFIWSVKLKLNNKNETQASHVLNLVISKFANYQVRSIGKLVIWTQIIWVTFGDVIIISIPGHLQLSAGFIPDTLETYKRIGT